LYFEAAVSAYRARGMFDTSFLISSTAAKSIFAIWSRAGSSARSMMSAFVNAASTRSFPVPLHPARQRQRGFNQAELLADWLSDHLMLPLRRHCNASITPRPRRLSIAPSGCKICGAHSVYEKGRRAKLAGAFN